MNRFRCLLVFTTASALVQLTTACADTVFAKGNAEELERTVKSLVTSRRFADLERLRAELATSKERFSSGSWKLESYYDLLGVATGGLDDVELLRAWERQEPQSATPHVGLAIRSLSSARHERPNSPLAFGSPPWKALHKRLDEAWREIEIALSKPNADIAAKHVRLKIAFYGDAPKEDTDAFFNDAIAQEPTYIGIYTTALLGLQRGRNYDRTASLPLIELAVQRTQSVYGTGMYGHLVWELLRHDRSLGFADIGVPWQQVDIGFRDYQDRFPGPRIFARHAWVAARANEAASARYALERYGTTFDRFAADSFENDATLSAVRRWAFEGKPNPFTQQQ